MNSNTMVDLFKDNEDRDQAIALQFLLMECSHTRQEAMRFGPYCAKPQLATVRMLSRRQHSTIRSYSWPKNPLGSGFISISIY